MAVPIVFSKRIGRGVPPDPDHLPAVPWNSPAMKNAAWLALPLGARRDLSQAEYAAVLPARGPRGSILNRCRGARIRILNNRGFTVQGHVCK